MTVADGRSEPAPGPTRLAQLRRALDRPGGRWALGVALSARASVQEGGFCRVRPSADGTWVYRYPGEHVPVPTSAPPDASPGYRLRTYFEVFVQEHRPGPGEVVVDVGAGVGDEVVPFSRLVGPSGRVVAVEAHPRTYAWLVRRIRENRLANVTPVNVAVTDRAGEVGLSDGLDHEANTVVGAAGVLRVTATTLADLLDGLGIDTVDLLKMNIEGAEAAAVAGMAPVAERVRNVCISCHDFLADETGDDAFRTHGEVTRRLREMGYHVVERHPGDRRPWARGYVYGRRPGPPSHGA